jgi:hypothetical protein
MATIISNTGPSLSRMFSGDLPPDYTTLHTYAVHTDILTFSVWREICTLQK